MLACAVGVPLVAMSGASWSEIAKKFQNLRWPRVVESASASTPNPPPLSEAPRFVPTGSTDAPESAEGVALVIPAPPANVATPAAAPSSEFGGIPERLQKLGATYYVLESWGNDQHLYRFYCRMAVAGSVNYTHCFEATDTDPGQAMQQVLQQVESWRQHTDSGG
jgi:hypothetical protein